MQRTVRTIDLSLLRRRGHPGVDVHRIRRHMPTSAHDHLFLEIVVIERGTAVHETVQGSHRLRAGDVIVVCPRVWHAYVQPRSFSIVNCLMDTQLIRRFAPALSMTPGVWDLLRPREPDRDPPVVLHARRDELAAMTQRINAIVAEETEQREGWQATVSLMAIELLVLTVRLWRRLVPPTAPAPPDNRVEHAMREAVAYVESHFNRPIRLDDLAQRVHMSPGYLSRRFAQRMGMGVIDFVHCLRTEEACRWLASTDRPIKHIAAEVGYNEVAYFSRCFRRQIGMSPRQYRRQRRPIEPGAAAARPPHAIRFVASTRRLPATPGAARAAG